MRKLALFGCLIAALSSVCLAGFEPDKLELRLGLGPAWWCGGDFNRGIRGENDLLEVDTRDYDGTFRPLGLGYGLSLGAVYWVKPHLGVGLDLSYARAPVGEYEVWMDMEYYMQTSTLSYGASALAVRPSFHYGFPLCDESFLDFFFGPSLYCGRFNFNKNFIIEPHGMDYSYEFKGRSTSLGLHGGVGVDYKLSDRLSLFGSLDFDVTSLKNLKDEWAINWRNLSESGSASGTGDTLWAFDFQSGGTKYTLWSFSGEDDPPVETGDVSNVRKGSIGGPAIGLRLGVKYFF